MAECVSLSASESEGSLACRDKRISVIQEEVLDTNMSTPRMTLRALTTYWRVVWEMGRALALPLSY